MTVLPMRLGEARPDACPLRLDETAGENREALLRVFDRLEAVEARYAALAEGYTAVQAELVAANATIAELQDVVTALGRLSSAFADEASRVAPRDDGTASS